MSNDNYPAGVTDAHPHFNELRVSASAVECGADEALVVPSFAVKADLKHLHDYVLQMVKLGHDSPSQIMGTVAGKIELMLERVTVLEQEREYECPFNDDVDLPESECAQWVCPVCGNDRETDTLPEERDPDEEWDRRNER